MSIYLKINTKNEVEMVHYMPFHEVHGLKKSKEELEQEGVFVETIQEPEQIDGQAAIMKWDGERIYYDYQEIPKSAEETQMEQLQNKIDAIIKTPDDIYKETDKNAVTLDELKKLKENQLSYLCTQSINSYFSYKPINSEQVYLFSYDTEAQGNFTDTLLAISGGAVTEVTWTAHAIETMEVVRVTLTAQDFQLLVGVIMQHKNGNISKFRDTLMPLVSAATTKAKVDKVVWE